MHMRDLVNIAERLPSVYMAVQNGITGLKDISFLFSQRRKRLERVKTSVVLTGSY